jgi:hypothetical protein
VSDPAAAVAALAGHRAPWIFGVRHHSPACAAALPALLDALRPTRLFIELPPELAPLLPHLCHPEARGPLAATVDAGLPGAPQLAFYPFAEFSPELVALRWAAAHGVPVDLFDLPVACRADGDGLASGQALSGEPAGAAPDGDGGAGPPAAPAWTGPWGDDPADEDDRWERAVEQAAAGAPPEALRRAALLYGWAVRASGPADAELLRREAQMRARLKALGADGAAAIVGAAHAPALIGAPPPGLDPHPRRADPGPPPARALPAVLLPWSSARLDPSSGYPAGIPDPAFQQRRYEALQSDPPPADGGLTAAAVEVCRALRARGHVASLPDAREAARVALELAALRDLPMPGRRELREALTLALGQGEPQGRGLPAAMDEVLIGDAHGRLPPGAPRAGLEVQVEALVAALRLPGPGEPERELELDPLRSELDRRRHVALRRLELLGVPYATPEAPADDEGDDDPDAPRVRVRWTARWTPATTAALALSAGRGPDLRTAAAERLREQRAARVADGADLPAARLDELAAAAEAGLGPEVDRALAELPAAVLPLADLPLLTRAVDLIERLDRGQIPGLPPEGAGSPPTLPGAVPPHRPAGLGPAAGPGDGGGPAEAPAEALADRLLAAAVRCLDGLMGAASADDARAVGALCRAAARRGGPLGRLRLGLRALREGGAPIAQGAAAAGLLVLDPAEEAAVAAELGGRLQPTHPDARAALSGYLRGLLWGSPGAPAAHPALWAALRWGVEAPPDAALLPLLPALREGFGALSSDARGRMLDRLSAELGGWDGPRAALFALDAPPEVRLAWARAELAARGALADAGLLPAPAWTDDPAGPPPPAPAADPEALLPPIERWRLILARERRRLSPLARRLARGLSGPGGAGDAGPWGGDEAPLPTARAWAAELDELFGAQVRQEVLGRAAEGGHAQAALELDPDEVRPSVELLGAVLRLRGGLPEADRARARRLIAALVAQLTEALSRRLRPALSGLTAPRSTRHRTDRPDLPGLLRANLHTARRGPDGEVRLHIEHLRFRRRSRRSLDWRVMLVVDTSGSMEASVLHAAMMAAILGGLPAVDLRFYAFSTEVVDLSDHADDPLALLLEVQIGGGTDIGRALAFARAQVRVPSRTLLVLLSDFEEGGRPARMLAEARALVQAGVRCLGLAALGDDAAPRYSVPMAEQLVAAGVPVAALSPLELARWVGEQLR